VSDTIISEQSLLLQRGDCASDHFTVWPFGADRVTKTERSVEGNVVVRDVGCWGGTEPDTVIPSVAVLDERVLISGLERSFNIVERNFKV